jgi:hypothetical protein
MTEQHPYPPVTSGVPYLGAAGDRLRSAERYGFNRLSVGDSMFISSKTTKTTTAHTRDTAHKWARRNGVKFRTAKCEGGPWGMPGVYGLGVWRIADDAEIARGPGQRARSVVRFSRRAGARS